MFSLLIVGNSSFLKENQCISSRHEIIVEEMTLAGGMKYQIAGSNIIHHTKIFAIYTEGVKGGIVKIQQFP